MRVLAALAALLIATPVLAQTPTPPEPHEEVFYHVFNRSMRDSNGDGHGDIQGMIDSLDYLKQLGVTSILLTPLYPSHLYHNYFASDFEGVDPEYGTMADYARLVAEVKARGMKIYLDQEMQYVADDHVWWAEPLADRSSPYTDWILWDDREGGLAEEGPFGLRAARNWSGRTTGITTVNLKNPEVKAYFDRYFMSWVDPNGDGDFSDGVDGFRIDHMMDDLDNKGLLTDLFDDFWIPLFTTLKAANPDLLILAEQWDWGYGGDFLQRGGADMAFAFPLRSAIRTFNRERIIDAIRGVADATPEGKSQLIFVENHDMDRLSSDPGMTPERQRTAAALTVLLRGTPMLYYGQEIGMRGTVRPRFTTDERDIGVREGLEWRAKVDAPETPHWYRGDAIYWTEQFSQDDDGVSVEEQDADPASLLNFYRRALAVRAEHETLQRGSQTIQESAAGLLIIERWLDGDRMMIIANLTPSEAEYSMPGPDLLGGARKDGDRVFLRPWQTALFHAPADGSVFPEIGDPDADPAAARDLGAGPGAKVGGE